MRPPDFDEADIWADAVDPYAIPPAAIALGCILALVVGVAALLRMN